MPQRIKENIRLHKVLAVADPRFPRGGFANSPGRGDSNIRFFPKFPKYCMKLKEFGLQGGRPSRPPLDPPLARKELNWTCIFDYIGSMKRNIIQRAFAVSEFRSTYSCVKCFPGGDHYWNLSAISYAHGTDTVARWKWSTRCKSYWHSAWVYSKKDTMDTESALSRWGII